MNQATRRPGPGARRGGERGFALLAALVTLIVLSILAAAGVFVARSEGRVSHSHAATVRARELARSGISEYLASGPPVAGETRVFVHGRDTAMISATRLLRVDVDSTRVLMRLTSRGVRVRRGRRNAERSLSTLVHRDESFAGGSAERPGTRHEPATP